MLVAHTSDKTLVTICLHFMQASSRLAVTFSLGLHATFKTHRDRGDKGKACHVLRSSTILKQQTDVFNPVRIP